MLNRNTLPPSHDRLLADCFLWCWNHHPATRRTMFHVRNETPKMPGESIQAFKQRLSMAKGMGIVPGVLDLIWYWGGRLYAFDIKIAGDKMSDDQLSFIAAITAQGGQGYEIRSLEAFIATVTSILENMAAKGL